MSGGSAGRGAMDVILEAFTPVEGKRLLDVGCGQGALSRSLARRGAQPVGIDPSAAAIAAARAKVPQARFEQVSGAALPFEDASFDGVIFLNSLHHIPPALMPLALEEAARVSGPGRRVLVIEPVAAGSFFEAVRPIEDETGVRALAAAALADCRRLRLLSEEAYERVERVAGLDAFLAPIAFIDPAREAVIQARRAEIAAAFAAHAVPSEGGFRLLQPMRAVLTEVV